MQTPLAPQNTPFPSLMKCSWTIHDHVCFKICSVITDIDNRKCKNKQINSGRKYL